MKKKIISCTALLFFLIAFAGCGKINPAEMNAGTSKPLNTMELKYADQFSVDYYEKGFKLISINEGDRFLIVPEGEKKPKALPESIKVIKQPVENIYIAATSSMCLFDALDRLDAIRFSGTRQDGWYIKNAADAMAKGEIIYAGKYSEPDYEMLLHENCDLAVESTMIGHASAVKDKLQSLGIPVLVDHSSMEAHPLGRCEWIKLYAAILNEEEKAEELFDEQAKCLDSLSEASSTGKTAAFFHISSSGFVVARRTGDYVSRMIELSGGDYIFKNLGDPKKASSTVTVEMEGFYSAAKEADFIFYNSTIGGEIKSMQEFLSLNSLLGNFKAVKNNNVWCTGKNMFQETMQFGEMIKEMNTIFTSEDPGLIKTDYFFKLQ